MMDEYRRIAEEQKKDNLCWSIVLIVVGFIIFATGIYLLSVWDNRFSDYVMLVAMLFLLMAFFVIAYIEISEYIRMKRQALQPTNVSELYLQQPQEVLTTARYMKHVFTEHAHSMFLEIYLYQLEVKLLLGGLMLLILYILSWVVSYGVLFDAEYSGMDFKVLVLMVTACSFMVYGFAGTEIRRLNRQIKKEGMNRGEIVREYQRGVVYTFQSGYFNVSPNYTFVIHGKESVIIPNRELVGITDDIVNFNIKMNGVPSSQKTYWLDLHTRYHGNIRIQCNAITGTMMMHAIEQKIKEST